MHINDRWNERRVPAFESLGSIGIENYAPQITDFTINSFYTLLRLLKAYL